jgi:hypothetical protein
MEVGKTKEEGERLMTAVAAGANEGECAGEGNSLEIICLISLKF